MGLLSFLFGNNQNLYSYKKMYLGKIIKGNKIVDIGKIYFNSKLVIYFDLMCCKCKRIQRVNDLESTYTCICYGRKHNNNNNIKYRKNDIRKILTERLIEKEKIDDFWDKKMIPSKIYICSNVPGEKPFFKSFENGGSAFPKYISYFMKDDHLSGIGLCKINELSTDYFISDYIYYTNNEGYIKFKNVYDNFEYEFKPILYYVVNDKEVNPNNTIINNFEMNELIYIFFEKDKNNFNLYKYRNNQLINKISRISRVIKKEQFGYLLEFNDGVKRFYSLIDDKLYDTNDSSSKSDKAYKFIDYNTNLYINSNKINNVIDKTLQSTLINITKTNNTLYKKIYVSRNEKLSNKVLFKYLTDNNRLVSIPNEFNDDKNEIYSAIIDRNDKTTISFIEYLSEIKKADDYKFKVYGINLNIIISTLFSNYEFKNKICELLEKEILNIENEKLKNNYINFIYNHYFDTNNTNIQICNKLKKKYNVDDLGLFLLLLYKYGEENVLDIPNVENKIINVEQYCTSVRYTCDSRENKELYDEIISSIDSNEIKWKSEHMLYKLLKSYFSDAVFQYRDTFLGQQSLDVYIPSLKIAFEYQGLQHYEPVEVFGGEEHFLKQQSNDKKKKSICRKKNIELIEWKYNEKIDKITLDKKLYHLKSQIGKNYIFSDIN